MKTKPTKAILAGVGATLVALLTALGPLQGALADDHIDAGEATTLGGVAVALIATVYAVWRAPNKPVDGSGAGQ